MWCLYNDQYLWRAREDQFIQTNILITAGDLLSLETFSYVAQSARLKSFQSNITNTCSRYCRYTSHSGPNTAHPMRKWC
jgi:hypothetical protein